MKKILYLTLSFILVAFSSCAKPDEEYVHDDCTVHAMYMVTPLSTVAKQLVGDIDQDNGTISFSIPREQARYWKDKDGVPTKVKLSANLAYDAFVSPSLLGLHDIIDRSLEITVTANMTGKSKKYTITASFER